MRSVFPILGLMLLLGLPAGTAHADGIPEVHFAIFRLDFQTYTVKGVYEASQPYRKILPAGTAVGETYFQILPAGDFGYTKIVSRLTGQELVDAETIWMGRGDLIAPPASAFDPNMAHGYDNPGPTAVYHESSAYYGGADPDLAWNVVRDSDAIHRLASYGDPYEVVVYDHFYTVGLSDPSTAEWFVLAYTTPPPPRDLAILGMNWPRGESTRGVASTPEFQVHNFGGAAENASLELRLESGGATLYQHTVSGIAVDPDATTTVFLPEWTPTSVGPVNAVFRLLNGGSAWSDPYPDNDQGAGDLTVGTLPIFRLRSSPYPPRAFPLDFDGDGDFDFYTWSSTPALLENRGAGGYVDITANIGVTLPSWTQVPLTGDFDGDGHRDLLVTGSYTPPLLLLGDGAGHFTQGTQAAGLGDLQGYRAYLAFDMDRDNDLDLVLVHDNVTYLYRNDGSGHFEDVTGASGVDNTVSVSAIRSGDLNGDGYQDLVVVNWVNPCRVFVNNGNGTFAPLDGPWDGLTVYGRDAVLFDAGRDGDTDFLLLNSLYDASSIFYENRGAAGFVDASAEAGPFGPAFNGTAGDVNGDGVADLFLQDVHGSSLRISENGRFVEHNELLTGYSSDYSDFAGSPFPRLLDLNGDGNLDVYTGSVALLNQGVDPTLAPTPVDLLYFRAIRDNGAATLSWGVSSATGYAGFHVYREAADGTRMRLTSALLGNRTEYTFSDPEAPQSETRYWLAEIGRTGESTWLGPVTVPAGSPAYRFQLVQNRPNPFTASTTIEFLLPTPERARVRVFDTAGRLVRTLADGVMAEGRHEIVWDARDAAGQRMAAGIYLYRLEAGSRSEVRRLVLLPR